MSNLTKHELKKISKEIVERTKAYYKRDKEVCKFHNWLARMYALFHKGRSVYPSPSKSELEVYKKRFENRSTNLEKWNRYKKVF